MSQDSKPGFYNEYGQIADPSKAHELANIVNDAVKIADSLEANMAGEKTEIQKNNQQIIDSLMTKYPFGLAEVVDPRSGIKVAYINVAPSFGLLSSKYRNNNGPEVYALSEDGFVHWTAIRDGELASHMDTEVYRVVLAIQSGQNYGTSYGEPIEFGGKSIMDMPQDVLIQFKNTLEYVDIANKNSAKKDKPSVSGFLSKF